MAVVPGVLGIRDVGSGFRDDGLIESTETADVLKGICCSGIANTILDAREANNAPLVAGRWREIRRQPEFDFFRVIGEQNGVDVVEKVADTRHVETLRGTNFIDILGKGVATTMERIFKGNGILVLLFLQSTSIPLIRRGSYEGKEVRTEQFQSPVPVGQTQQASFGARTWYRPCVCLNLPSRVELSRQPMPHLSEN